MKNLKNIALLLTMSLVMLSCQEDEAPPQAPAIAEFEGVYVTETSHWGEYFSPLVITQEGKLFIAEHEIVFEFDELTGQLIFDSHEIKNTTAKGNIVFTKKVDGRLQFGGTINPRPQDGPVS